MGGEAMDPVSQWLIGGSILLFLIVTALRIGHRESFYLLQVFLMRLSDRFVLFFIPPSVRIARQDKKHRAKVRIAKRLWFWASAVILPTWYVFGYHIAVALALETTFLAFMIIDETP